MSVFIIAEAGVNHNGNLNLALKMVEAASQANVNAIKFQTFRADALVTKTASKASYQEETTGIAETQFEMLKKLELDLDAHKLLMARCQEMHIDFLSSPFDLTTIDLLAGIGMKIWKIPSGEITNLPYLKKIGSLGQNIILSTGMSNLGEIEDALDILKNAGTPRNKITVLHCNTEYPTPTQDVNLKAMLTIQHAFPGVQVGYSDHTEGIEVSIAATAMGATVIEKHFTLDKNMAGPDQRASLDPDELSAMVKGIRNIEIAIGSGNKKPSPSELKNLPIVRKSIVAACPILKDEIYTEENITVKRPGTGISPMRWDDIIGQQAKRNYEKDEVLEA